MEDLVELDEYNLLPILKKTGKYSIEAHKAVIDAIESFAVNYIEKTKLIKNEEFLKVNSALNEILQKYPKDNFNLDELMQSFSNEIEKLSILKNELKSKSKSLKLGKSEYDEYGVSSALKAHDIYSKETVDQITKKVDSLLRYALSSDDGNRVAAINEALCYNRMAKDDLRKFCYRLDKENPDDLSKMKSFIQERISDIVQGYEEGLKQ